MTRLHPSCVEQSEEDATAPALLETPSRYVNTKEGVIEARHRISELSYEDALGAALESILLGKDGTRFHAQVRDALLQHVNSFTTADNMHTFISDGTDFHEPLHIQFAARSIIHTGARRVQVGPFSKDSEGILLYISLQVGPTHICLIQTNLGGLKREPNPDDTRRYWFSSAGHQSSCKLNHSKCEAGYSPIGPLLESIRALRLDAPSASVDAATAVHYIIQKLVRIYQNQPYGVVHLGRFLNSLRHAFPKEEQLFTGDIPSWSVRAQKGRHFDYSVLQSILPGWWQPLLHVMANEDKIEDALQGVTRDILDNPRYSLTAKRWAVGLLAGMPSDDPLYASTLSTAARKLCTGEFSLDGVSPRYALPLVEHAWKDGYAEIKLTTDTLFV